VNVPDYMVRGGATYRILHDHLGSPRLVVNTSTGAVAQRMDFDEWGIVTTDTNPGWQPFGFAGGLADAASSLTRYWMRDFSGTVGRYLAKDPLGFSGGEANLYSYVSSDPLNFVDPFGFWTFAAEYGTTGDGLSENVRGIEATVDQAFQASAKRDAIVTYTTNGKHKENSLHYLGDAVDLRTRDLSKAQVKEIVTRLRKDLGDAFDVLNEGDHIHVEYDPPADDNEAPAEPSDSPMPELTDPDVLMPGGPCEP
jgi:RHS repeat-associated protein